MEEGENTRGHYDLEDRTYLFAKKAREFSRRLPRTMANIEDGRQLARSSGSVAANYIEANESLSAKDFLHRIKICRKEAKESRLWLRLLYFSDEAVDLDVERKMLVQEAFELTRIFGSIIHDREGTRIKQGDGSMSEGNVIEF